jgi:predicted GIY-YIG superfamily endonuclease
MPRRVSAALVELATQPHALYRFFDATDVLLYVGITADLPARMKKHRSEKPWWVHVHHITVEQFDTRQEALDAEALAIRWEGPLHNDQHNRQVWVDSRELRPESIDGEWLVENWPKVPATVRDYVEIPAWTQGRAELAQWLLDETPTGDLERYAESAQELAKADGEDDLDGPEVTARTAMEAFVGISGNLYQATNALENLLRCILTDQFDERLAKSAAEIEERLGGVNVEFESVTWLAHQVCYDLDGRYFDRLSEQEKALWWTAAVNGAPFADDAGLRQDAGRYARLFKLQGIRPSGLCEATDDGLICVDRVQHRVQFADCPYCTGLARCGWHRMWCERHLKLATEAEEWRDADGNLLIILGTVPKSELEIEF